MHTKPLRILVLFYSLTGETAKLAEHVAAGARELPDVEVAIKHVPELIPDAVFAKKPELAKHRADLEARYPLATLDDFIQADGIALGTPVHFGSFAAQLKQFIDQLSPIWIEGKMLSKPAALFCSSGSMHGGEEATLLSLMIPLLNLGMIPVGIPYPIQGQSKDFDAGSPYGAVFVSGHSGQNELSSEDAMIAQLLGKRLVMMTQLLSCDCETCARAKKMLETTAK